MYYVWDSANAKSGLNRGVACRDGPYEGFVCIEKFFHSLPLNVAISSSNGLTSVRLENREISGTSVFTARKV